MSTHQPTLSPPIAWRRPLIVSLSAVALVVATVAATLYAADRSSETAEPAQTFVPVATSSTPLSAQAIMQDLAARGVIPAQSVSGPAETQSLLHDLATRGVIPAQTVDAAAILSPKVAAEVDEVGRDAMIAELADRGLIPAQSVEDRTHDRDALLYDLVERGLIPAQTLGG